MAPLPLDEPGDLFLNPSAVGLVPWWFVTASDGESRAQRWYRGLDTLSLDGILIESARVAADNSDKGNSWWNAEDNARRRRWM